MGLVIINEEKDHNRTNCMYCTLISVKIRNGLITRVIVWSSLHIGSSCRLALYTKEQNTCLNYTVVGQTTGQHDECLSQETLN